MKNFRIATGLFVATVAVGSTAIAQQVVVVDPGSAITEVPRVAVNPNIPIIQPKIVISDIHFQPKARIINVAQVKDDLLKGTEKFAQGASKVTEINLDPSTMGMMEEEHGRRAEVARKMDLMVVHSYAYDKPGMYRKEDVEAVRKKLEDGSWSCSIHVRNENGSTDICSRQSSDHETNEMVIIAAGAQKLTFIHMKGRVPLSELGNMSGDEKEMTRPPKWSRVPRATPEPPPAPASPGSPAPAPVPTPPM